jgi:hypothetical protein
MRLVIIREVRMGEEPLEGVVLNWIASIPKAVMIISLK